MSNDEKEKNEAELFSEDRENKVKECIEALKKEGIVNAIPSEEAEDIKRRRRAVKKAWERKLEKRRKVAKEASKQRRNNRR